jgi:hypothetical protein
VGGLRAVSEGNPLQERLGQRNINPEGKKKRRVGKRDREGERKCTEPSL